MSAENFPKGHLLFKTSTVDDSDVAYNIAVASGLPDPLNPRSPEFYANEFGHEEFNQDNSLGMRGFIAYEGVKPVGFLTISDVSVEGSVVSVELGDFATVPERRSFQLLSGMVDNLVSQQQDGFQYAYLGYAKANTSYHGLK